MVYFYNHPRLAPGSCVIGSRFADRHPAPMSIVARVHAVRHTKCWLRPAFPAFLTVFSGSWSKQARPSIHADAVAPSSMVGRLAAVPEESMDCSTAAYPPRSVYCDRIRKVAVSGVQIRSTICSHSQSGHSGSRSSCSTASNSYPSNNSGCSSGSASDVVLEYSRAQEELNRIARQMVSDGYTQRMVQAIAFHVAPPAPAQALGNGGGPDSALETCFSDLDVGWVLQIGRQEHGSLRQLRLQDQSASRDLVERWIRGLTVIVQNII